VSELIADFESKIGYRAIEESAELNLLEVFLAEQGRLKRIVAGMGLNAADSEDVLQDVSVKSLKQSGRFETKQEYIRWLIRVTINRCLAEHRRGKSFRRKAGEILRKRRENQVNTMEKNVVIEEELEIVRESLRKLDGFLLVPVFLRYFCDLDSKEIGEILEQNPSTVRSRLREARLILAKNLLERGVEP